MAGQYWQAGEPHPAAKGAAPAAGVSGFAVVRAVDGTVQFGSNVTAAQRFGVGVYGVAFNSDVSRCAYAATLGDPVAHKSGPPPFGFVSVVNAFRIFGDKQAVIVEVADPGGSHADLNFHLTVTC